MPAFSRMKSASPGLSADCSTYAVRASRIALASSRLRVTFSYTKSIIARSLRNRLVMVLDR